MRKMGINLVRFHHMDNPWTGNEGTIFDRNLNNTRSLDPVTLDRLHYFLAQLKRNNIYVNMNLHVSRTFKEGDGVLHADSIVDFGKAVTYFDDHLVDLQKEYAEQLLTSVNPYTGLAMVDDPVLGMVEIANENTLYGFWKDNRLQPFSAGGSILQPTRRYAGHEMACLFRAEIWHHREPTNPPGKRGAAPLALGTYSKMVVLNQEILVRPGNWNCMKRLQLP